MRIVVSEEREGEGWGVGTERGRKKDIKSETETKRGRKVNLKKSNAKYDYNISHLYALQVN